MNPSEIRDPGLAPEGRRRIEWAAAHMPVLAAYERELRESGALAGRRIAICLHLEAKTARLALALQVAGAEVAIAGSNPLSTQDAVAAALAEQGVAVYAWRGCTAAEYERFLRRLLDARPELLVDDGGDLVSLLHRERPDQCEAVLGGCEETTTGLHRLRSMAAEGALRFPMVAVNDARMKYLFDNRYGTGQSVWDAILRTTNLTVAGKVAVVVGYGWCGKGVARRAQGLGARVIACEVDPIAANEALMDGFEVMPIAEAAARADFLITVTGMAGAVGPEGIAALKDGAILCNAGHFDVEIDKEALAGRSCGRRVVREGIEEYRFPDGRRCYLLAEGRLVNLAAGDGHPIEVMDLSFALQAASLAHLATAPRGTLPPQVIPVPPEVDQRVASLRLAALGVRIDRWSERQQRYHHSWQEGTR